MVNSSEVTPSTPAPAEPWWRRRDERSLGLAVFVVSIVLNLALSLVGLTQSPRGIHEFRQVQTALTSREILEHGWSLDYPTPLFGPPWSAPMEFPLYEVAAAQLARVTGLAIEPAARLVSLLCLYLALPACFQLLGLLSIPRVRRWPMLGILLLSPIFVYYSRSIMIESAALCAAAWFLLAYVRALDRGAHRWLLVAALAGILGALAKVTTLCVFLGVAALFTLDRLRQLWTDPARRPADFAATCLRALAATVPGVLVGWAWVRYSDGIKLSNPLSAFLASGSLNTFTFGTLAQRLEPEFWQRFVHHTTHSVLASFNLALVAIFAVFASRGHWRRLLLLGAGFVLGPLVFANLYFVHDYYYYANSLFLLGALALAWDQLLNTPGFRPAARWALIGLSLAVEVFSYLTSYFPSQRHQLAEPPELATALAAALPPEEVFVTFGHDWEAMVPYFSHRRAIMVTDQHSANLDDLNRVLDRVEPGRVTALVVSGRLRSFPAFFKPLIARLHLHPAAVLMSEDTLVYFAESRLARAVSRLQALPLKTLTFTDPADAEGSALPRHRYLPAQLTDPRLTSMMSPKPLFILHPYGLAAHEIDGQLVFNAHAPTDVVLPLAPGRREATVAFGLLPGAYTLPNATEGVEFRVEWVDGDGVHHPLQHLYLDPSRVTADRGGHSLQVALPPGAAGQLWFRTLPGSTGSITCTWAYWSRIEIK